MSDSQAYTVYSKICVKRISIILFSPINYLFMVQIQA